MDDFDSRVLWEANAPAWIEMSRAGHDRYRDLVNTPAFLELLPPVEGLDVLDLGCGEGHNTRLVAERGAEVVVLDISWPFVVAAREASPQMPHVHGDGCRLPFANSAFEAVTAFMSLMDVPDPEAALREVARVLRPGGFVQASIVHPLTLTPLREWALDELGDRAGLTIGGYFERGTVTERWTFSTAPEEMRARHDPFRITYARRTLAGWLNAFAGAGLSIEAAVEPSADEATAMAHPEVADTRIVPYFLILQARKH